MEDLWLTRQTILFIVGENSTLMNFKLICKTLLIIAVLVVLVMIIMENDKDTAKLFLPQFVPLRQPLVSCRAALMYVGFFGFGYLIGTLMMAGGKKGAAKSARPEK